MRADQHPLAVWLRALWPVPLAAGRRELWLGGLGVGLGLLGTEWLGRHWLGGSHLWFIAPMGASAVLLFMLPASPLAQPWAALGGNLVSALIGLLAYRWLGDSGPVAALAGAVAVGAMAVLRCLHPPGGAVALTAVLGGAEVHRLGLGFAFGPVLVNSACMVLLALLFHHLAGRRYPHHAAPAPHRTSDPLPTHRTGVQPTDLDAALASFGEVLDIDRDDLEEIMVRAQLHAQRRHWAGVLCEHIMSRDVVRIGSDDSVDEAWRRLASHKVKALPVTEANGRLVGIVSLHDFFIGQSAPVPPRPPLLSTARRVHEIMSRHVITARPHQSVADLVPGFSDGGLHHMPVVDGQDRVVGMVTQSDLVAALFKNRFPANGAA
ncbi:HPP family protein [Hydrogenophaga defluvii]|uniref:HPP family protein n=1 Tax=Hydrogenophaga defluvii TaxID=249410 RepID=A0ABW2SB81_9BURK